MAKSIISKSARIKDMENKIKAVVSKILPHNAEGSFIREMLFQECGEVIDWIHTGTILKSHFPEMKEEIDKILLDDATFMEVGDTVLWKGSWGGDSLKKAVVTFIEKTSSPHTKYGTPVKSIEWKQVRKDKCVVNLKNGHWAYGSQLYPLTSQEG